MAIAHPHPVCREPRRVLVVEDDPDGRESLRLLLTAVGFEVEVAADGFEGVLKGRANRPGLAVIDIGLPGLDGCAVARQLRHYWGREIVLVAYTAYDSHESRRKVEDAGFNAHVVKPAPLLEHLAALIDMRTEMG